ncbi:MAG: Nramp family divalent metal transporter, partial [Chloroflexota bacterium]|nr:Nramp family divalent metal transporter [Chloroflexota bacterium]
MKKVLQIALGVVAAFGGFVDIGELVFNVQAGAQFGYQLLWVVPIGVVGIAVYAEMCGRVAIVTKRPVFDVVRQRMGFGLGLGTLISSELINLLTLTAEVGGIALILQLLFPDLPFRILLLLGTAGVVALIKLLPFSGIERVFGYGGCLLIVFVVAAVHLKPDWGDVADGFVPHWQTGTDALIYWYFAVGVLAAALVPYEVFFYSSGAVEEGWGESDMIVNRANAVIGWGLGGILSVSLIVVSAQLFEPLSIEPNFIGTTALAAQLPLGSAAFLIAVLGMLFAVGGAAAEVSFSGGYCIAQFLGWEWGKYRGAREAPRFTAAWLLMFAIAFVVVLTGAN